MSGIKDLLFEEENVDDICEGAGCERTYPVKMNVDGYDVNHYYDGDIPIYELRDDNGNIIGYAQSTYELREITQNLRDEE